MKLGALVSESDGTIWIIQMCFFMYSLHALHSCFFYRIQCTTPSLIHINVRCDLFTKVSFISFIVFALVCNYYIFASHSSQCAQVALSKGLCHRQSWWLLSTFCDQQSKCIATRVLRGAVNPCRLRVPAFAGRVREPALLCRRVRGGCGLPCCVAGAGCTWCGCGAGEGCEVLCAGNWVLSQSKWT